MDSDENNGRYRDLPPPLTSGGQLVFDDRKALVRRIIMTEVLGPPLALRKQQSAPSPGPPRKGK